MVDCCRQRCFDGFAMLRKVGELRIILARNGAVRAGHSLNPLDARAGSE